VIDALRERELLPVIYFIFSRAACDDAVRACLDAGLRLTELEERRRIRDIVEDHVAALSDDDLAVLGYDRFMAGLEAGLASHHAGMVPPFKEAVEACFTEGLVRWWSPPRRWLGINMPARTVVIEKLTVAGERHGSDPRAVPNSPVGPAAGHRHPGLRGELVAVHRLRRGGRARIEPQLHAQLGLPTDLQHGRQPGAPLRRGPGPPAQPLPPAVQADQAVVRMETRLACEAALAGARAEAG
jgi:hypothetical protein